MGLRLILKLMVLAAVLSACSFSKNKDDKKGDERGTTTAPADLPGDNIEKDEFKITAIPQDEFQKYTLRISWPEGRNASVSVRQEGMDYIAQERQPKEKSFVDFECSAPGTIGFYIVVSRNGQKSPNAFSVAADCPLDIRVNGTGSNPFSKEKSKIGRLFLEANSEINLNGNSLNVKINRLIVTGNVTINTYLNSSPRVGQENPPKLTLHIAEIVAPKKQFLSIMKFNLIGLNGKWGRSGEAKALLDKKYSEERSKPRHGADGVKGSQDNACTPEERYRMFEQRGLQLPCLNVQKCYQEPTAGKDGLDGVPGMDGDDGDPGMDTPELVFLVEKEPKNFILELNYKPGYGGPGGAGLKAVPPGDGGVGAEELSACTYKLQHGKRGRPAVDGLNGLPGKHGEHRPATVSSNVQISHTYGEPPKPEFRPSAEQLKSDLEKAETAAP